MRFFLSLAFLSVASLPTAPPLRPPAASPADELIRQLEKKAAAVRGLEIFSTVSVDRQRYDDNLYEDHGEGRIRVTTDGILRNDFWSFRVAPDLRGGRLRTSRHLYTRKGARYWDEDVSFYVGNSIDRSRLKPSPWKVDWKDRVHGDPWVSTPSSKAQGGIDPLTLYSLLPAVAFGTEPERTRVEKEDHWILACRRPRPEGPVTKRAHVRKSDLALTRLEVEIVRGKYTYRHDIRAERVEPVHGYARPSLVRASLYGGSRHEEFVYALKRSRARLSPDSGPGFSEPLFATVGLPDDRGPRLSRILRPEDPQPLVELAFNRFPRGRWWSHRFFEKRERILLHLGPLCALKPESRLAREAYLSWIADPKDRRLGRISTDTAAPLFNLGKLLLAAGEPAEAEELARRGRKGAANKGEELLWLGLLCHSLAGGGKRREAATEWLDFAGTFSRPRVQVLLSRHARARGIASILDMEVLKERADEAQATLLLLQEGPPDACLGVVARAAVDPAFRPVVSESATRRLSELAPAPDLIEKLSAVPDIDLQMASAALARAAGKDPAPYGEKAIALWEEKVSFAPGKMEGGRKTLRLLDQLSAVGAEELRARLCLRFGRRLEASGVGHWLGYYRWGESIARSAAWLLERNLTDRFIELALAAPASASRLRSRDLRKKNLSLPLERVLEHLRKTRDPKEAETWVRLFGWSSRENKKELARLAYELNPDSYWVKEMWVRKGAEEGDLARAIEEQRKIVTAMKARKYGGRTNNPGMAAEELAKLLVKAHRFEEAVEVCREVVRESLSLYASSLTNLGARMGQSGRKDLEREVNLIAARFNAHMSPRHVDNLAERLIRQGDPEEAYSLIVTTLVVWSDHTGRERGRLRELEQMKENLDVEVGWDDLFRAFLQEERPPLEQGRMRHARRAVDELSSEDPGARLRAVRILNAIGPRAAGLLKASLDSRDLELRSRAREIVQAWYSEAMQ